MQTATTQKVVNALSPARRVPDMRHAAVNTNVAANPVRPFYKRLHRPSSSRIRLAATSVAAKQIKPAPRVLASRTTTSASAPRVPKLLARARADYKQINDSKIGKTRIPKPTITAVKEANVRRQSRLWARMASVVIRRSARAPAAEPATVVEEDEEELDEEPEKSTIKFEEPPPELDEPTDNDMDNTSLMFNDNSFDESISPDQQSSAMNLFGRKMASMKRLGMGLRTNKDWFVGLSQCPDYTGDFVRLQRVRSRTVVKAEADLLEDEQGVADEPTLTKVPAPRLPVVKPASAVAAKISGRGTKQQVANPKTKSASPFNRDAAVSKARKPVAPVAAVRKAPLKRGNIRPAVPNKSKSTSKPQLASKAAPAPSSERKVSRLSTRRPTSKPDARPSSKVNAALKSIVRKPNSKTVKKQVCFLEGPIEPRFYDTGDTVKQSAIAIDGSTASFSLEPLTGLLHSQSSRQGKGTTQLFDGTVNGALCLKQRFLNGYASVQRYEARRHEEASVRAERPALGQLEYGNADFKIVMQASGVITAHDIGMVQDLSAIGKAGKLLGGYQAMMTPVLVFGRFREPFENAVIPTKGVKAHKRPLRWPATGSETRLEKFAEEHLKRLQNAELIG